MRPLVTPGQMRTRVVFERPMLAADSTGAQAAQEWEQFEVWASVESSTGTFGARREFEAASQMWGENIKLVRVRYRPDLVAVDVSWRVLIGETYYNVLRPAEDVDMQHRELTVIVGVVT